MPAVAGTGEIASSSGASSAPPPLLDPQPSAQMVKSAMFQTGRMDILELSGALRGAVKRRGGRW
jgi:hypothetical protein